MLCRDRVCRDDRDCDVRVVNDVRGMHRGRDDRDRECPWNVRGMHRGVHRGVLCIVM